MYLPEQLRKFTILPVLVVDSVEQAVALTEALRSGGMLAVEVTLRTQVALSAMREIKLSFPDILLGAGTVNTPADMEAAAEAGADFAVSPGLTRLLAEQARSMRMPFLPGVSTASEVLGGMELGYDCFKFFPASAAGGPALLRALAGPFPGISFCPTGGIDMNNAADYLALPNVLCVGGSWMAGRAQVDAGDWQLITAQAQTSLARLRE
tara:strand:- start:52191 stop:52817 length:627 start_codon:yes stop_codon:yes gene_type:complete